MLNLLVAAAALSSPAQDTLAILDRLCSGVWTLTIETPNSRDHALLRYTREGDVVRSEGKAYSLAQGLTLVGSRYEIDADGTVRLSVAQGDLEMTGKAWVEGETLVTQYGPDTLRDRLTFVSPTEAEGTVSFGPDRPEIPYTMRRVSTPELTLAMLGFDPVELARGNRVAGDGAIESHYGHWTYRFANLANRDTFEKDPERWGLQFDGACMAMGPLSGRGQPGLFEVHEGRTYAFASQGCLDTFLNDPARYLELPEPPLDPSAENEAKAKAVLNSMASAHGLGAENIDLSWWTSTPDTSGGNQHKSVVGTVLTAKGLARIDSWDTTTYVSAAPWNGEGWSGRIDQPYPLVPSEAEYLRREALRYPLAILALRDRAELRADLAQSIEIKGLGRCPAVTVSVFGAVYTLAAHPETGRVAAIRFRIRGQTVTRHFTREQTATGVVFPTEWVRSAEGLDDAVGTLAGVSAGQTFSGILHHPAKF